MLSSGIYLRPIPQVVLMSLIRDMSEITLSKLPPHRPGAVICIVELISKLMLNLDSWYCITKQQILSAINIPLFSAI